MMMKDGNLTRQVCVADKPAGRSTAYLTGRRDVIASDKFLAGKCSHLECYRHSGHTKNSAHGIDLDWRSQMSSKDKDFREGYGLSCQQAASFITSVFL